jgi:hypothetical protein
MTKAFANQHKRSTNKRKISIYLLTVFNVLWRCQQQVRSTVEKFAEWNNKDSSG